MKLSEVERLMLSNQFKILGGLYPEEKEYYELHCKALEEGYRLHYDDAFETISSDELSEEECREVLDILNMYRALTFSYEKLKDKSRIRLESIRFRGFDGNDEEEGKRLSYTQYCINDLNRFVELKYGEERPRFNSHTLKLESYKNMLLEWSKLDNKYELSDDEIKRILNER